MGICSSSLSAAQKEALEESRRVDEQNAKDYQNEREKIKLLLLGAGESGKSTIFKQMKILYGAGFSQDELQSHTAHIYSNILVAIKAILSAAETFKLSDQVGCKSEFNLVMEAEDDAAVDGAMGAAIKALWADKAIQDTWDKRADYQVVETNAKFFDDIDRIAADDYVPTQDDFLKCRVRTSGIIEEHYIIDGINFVMFDVGGQRNERKKWIHCFDDVNAVIFVVALSEYDQMLFEDNTVNRMVEAIALFEEISNSRWFTHTSMILYLNKKDLFEGKIKKSSIKDAHEDFADYTGKPNDYDDGVKYFTDKFLAVNKNKSKQIFCHVTCATDPDNVKVVFNACKETILRDNLQGSGFMEWTAVNSDCVW